LSVGPIFPLSTESLIDSKSLLGTKSLLALLVDIITSFVELKLSVGPKFPVSTELLVDTIELKLSVGPKFPLSTESLIDPKSLLGVKSLLASLFDQKSSVGP